MIRRRLTYEDRQLIEVMNEQGAPYAEMAEKCDVHVATIHRELDRGKTGEINKAGRAGYSAKIAQEIIIKGRHSPRPRRWVG